MYKGSEYVFKQNIFKLKKSWKFQLNVDRYKEDRYLLHLEGYVDEPPDGKSENGMK